MTKNNSAAPATNKKQYDPCKSKPYNHYNGIHYILERERFLQSKPVYKNKSAAAAAKACFLDSVTGYELLDLPDIPRRYAGLNLPHDMPGKRKATKPDHDEIPVFASSQDIVARLVADRSIDAETLEYAMTAATILKRRHKEPKEMRGMGRFNEVDSSSAFFDVDTSYVENTWYCHKQPCHSRVSFPSTMSDSIENSSAATSTCSSLGTALGEYYSNNYDDTREVSPSRKMLSEVDIPEVDIPDQDIMKMWYLNNWRSASLST